MITKSKFGNLYLKMFQAVIDFALSPLNIAITNSLLPFKNGIQLLKTKNTTINNLRAQAKEVITGIAVEKRDKRKSITTVCYDMMKSVYAYAITTNNTSLASKMKITKQELNSLKANAFITKIQSVINMLNPIIDTLSPYATPDGLENLKTQLEEFTALNATPRNAIAHRKMLNESIQTGMNETIKLLSEVIDNVALNFATTHPEFLTEYKNNRRLVGNSKHTKLRVSVKDDLNQPIYGVTVLQNGTANAGITDINGKLDLHITVNDAQPVYRFTLSMGSQQIVTPYLEIKKGHTLSKSFIMAPSGFIIPKEEAVKPVPEKVIIEK